MFTESKDEAMAATQSEYFNKNFSEETESDSPIARGRWTYNSGVHVALHITTPTYYPSHPYGNA